VHEKFHVPAERLDLFPELAQRIERQHPFAFLQVDDVLPHPAHAGRVSLSSSFAEMSQGTTATPRSRAGFLRKGVEHGAVVGGVDARLHTARRARCRAKSSMRR